jgi:uncharacterized protein (DUF1800 family)
MTMARPTPLVEHLLRRAGFGATPEERDRFSRMTYPVAVASLLDFDPATADVDSRIGTPGYVGITTRGQFSPNQVIADSRQRWMFRMVHSPAPLLEKMTLFWHHHFATAYSKIAGTYGSTEGARMMAAKPSEDPGGTKGQIELLRELALGKFRDLLIQTAKDPAMLVWLDGRLNTRQRPQENYGRELMELFTFGVENYTEPDVYAAARVFTGWNLTILGQRGTASQYYAYVYNANQHDTNAKDFTFAVYPTGSKRIESRSAASGEQDGIDLINALAIHPETAKRLARRFWTWFVSETATPDPAWVDQIANVYLTNDTAIKPVLKAIFFSPEFMDSANFYQRYAWPVEFVVRSLKEMGFVGFSVDNTNTPLVNMGQQLFEPPDVNGWDLGPAWFSTAGTLARMNFASTLATNQRFNLRTLTSGARSTPESLVDFVIGTLSLPQPAPGVYQALLDYVRAGGTWTGSDAQLLNKAGGLYHLLTGSGDYQLV